MDKITQRICASLFGTAAVIFAFAFLIRSASPAQADVAPQTNYSTGKYMMEMSSLLDKNGDVNWYVLVWNTETGNSRFYYTNKGTRMGESPSHYQLPSSPL